MLVCHLPRTGLLWVTSRSPSRFRRLVARVTVRIDTFSFWARYNRPGLQKWAPEGLFLASRALRKRISSRIFRSTPVSCCHRVFSFLSVVLQLVGWFVMVSIVRSLSEAAMVYFLPP